MRRMALLLGLLATILVVTSSGQVSSPLSVLLRDEGTDQGLVRVLNCTGAGVTCSASGAVGTVNASGGAGSFAVTEVEIDFDTCGIGGPDQFDTCQVSVTDAGVSGTSKILAVQSAVAATSRDADENEMDQLVCLASPASGSFTLTCESQQGPTHGKFKINYTVG